MNCTTVCFAAQKGGCGKSTLCTSVASTLAYDLKKKIIVIDADELQHSIYTSREHNISSLETDKFLQKKFIDQGNEPYEIIVSKINETAEKLERIKKSNKYDFILVDTPGRVDKIHSKNMLKECNYIFIPFEEERKSLTANLEFLEFLIKSAKNDMYSSIKELCIVWNKVNPRTRKDLYLEIKSSLTNSDIMFLKTLIDYKEDYKRDVTQSTLFPIPTSLKETNLYKSILEIYNIINKKKKTYENKRKTKNRPTF